MKREDIIAELSKIHEEICSAWYNSLRMNDASDESKKFADLEPLESFQFDAFDYWIGDTAVEEKLNAEFAKFGIRGDGSSVAVWLKEDTHFSSAPVVLIGSEGELGIIAPNYLTFMLLSCLGYDMYQMLNFEKDGATLWKDKNQSVFDWLVTTYSLTVPENIQALIDKARAENESVEEYIASMKM